MTFFQSHLETGLFYLLAFLAIPLAYGVLFDPRIIRSGFLLIGVFGTISGIFFLLQAEFLALAQIMIYAVGITLVVVIALMLTNPKLESDKTRVVAEQRAPGIAVSIVLFITIYLALRSETWQTHAANAIKPDDALLQLGRQLLVQYAMPFEFASVLLLVALIGAIMLAKADRPAMKIESQESSERGKTSDVVKV
jgi:NAD(P)H-quinone oxidoreductase subunit 6